MAIASSLLKPIYVSYVLGESNGKIGYDEPIKIYAQIEDVKALVLRENVGIIANYDRLILVPYGEKTQFIDEQSLLWVDVEPNTKRNNMDYKIERVGDVIDGNFILYCKSLTPNTKSIYYEHKGKVYQAKIDFDNSKLVSILPVNKYLPIDNTTKIWTNSTMTSQIKLVKKELFGDSYKLTFQKVNE